MSAFISTQSISSSLRQSVLKMQTELAASETEVSTGNYADIGLSLGSETGQSVSLQAETSFLQTISDTNSSVSTRLSTIQNNLSEMQTSAQTLLNSLLATNGATTSAVTAQSTGSNSLKSLIATLNSTLNGDYIFSGINTGNAPVTDYSAANAPNKQAVDAAFAAAFGMSQTSAGVSGISGSAMQSFLNTQFASLFQGTNWTTNWSSASDQTLTNTIAPNQTENTSVTANQAAFQELTQAYVMVSDLGGQNLSQSAYQAVTNTASKLLTSAINGLTDIQAGVGVVQSSVASANSQMSLQMDILSTQVSNLESVNTYEASTRVSELQTQIETSYSLTSQLKQLSLVQFL
ncbi:flagellar hook-associated family protein [Methylocella tundrae]|uniref:Flagellin n=1 Tax=Methylocella tundrae TaxID=227605 RepID=A0A4U8YUQ1_METTU|nr:flagellar hook-associated family protein [Methylocella tundrae]WPP04739.1 flagellar hook-associated family protein [Methylocella tundrae]VFU06943.1 flagellar hook-associated protein FlgL [Methylocella tundrae]